jgi:hypothetical protein
MKFLSRFRRHVKVQLTCGCGRDFIPGAYRLGRKNPARYGCGTCGTKLQLSTFRGDVDW